MAKKSNDVVSEKVKVIRLVRSEGIAMGYEIYEIDLGTLKAGKFIEKSEPDVFSIFIMNITKYVRKYFEF